MIRIPDAAFVFLNSGVTMGACGIGVTADGHIVKIPSNNPEGYRMVQLGLETAMLSETVTDPSLKSEMRQNAARLVHAGRTLLESCLLSIPADARGQSSQVTGV